MADIDKVRVSGTDYYIKDSWARSNGHISSVNTQGNQFNTLKSFVEATANNNTYNTTKSGRFKTTNEGSWLPSGLAGNWYRFIVNYQNPWANGNTYGVGGNIILWSEDETKIYSGIINGKYADGNPTVKWTKIMTESSHILQTLTAVTANTDATKVAGGNAVKSVYSTLTGLSATVNTIKSDLTTKVNAINVYVGSDGKIHFKNGAGTDKALNFSRGSGEAYRFIENVGYGRTDKIGGLSNIVAVSLNSSVTISVSTSLAKYMYSNADDGNCNNAVPQGAYYGKTSGYTFDKCIQLTGSSFVNAVASWTVKGIKRGITIFSVVLKDSSTWYSRYLLVAVV